jgi:LCP family protein required for cell wall assembly
MIADRQKYGKGKAYTMTRIRKKRTKGSNPLRKKLKWVAISFTLVVLAFISYYLYSILQFGSIITKEPGESNWFKRSNSQPNDTNTGENNLKPAYVPPEWEGNERVNILLLGGDTRGLERGEAPRSDSMIVASLDPVTKQAYLFSILRDTYAPIPGHGKDRINAALAYGGPSLALETVSNFLNIPIQYYVYVDFEGFIALIDSIGGIEYYVEKDMYYSSKADGPEYDINLKKGLQTLDGKEALQYVRFRYDALSDYSRTERQRKFLKAVAEEMQKTSSLLKLPGTLRDIAPYIETNLSLSEMIKLGTLGFKSKAEGVISEQLPPSRLLREEVVNHMSVITVDPEELQAFIQEKFTKIKSDEDDNPAEAGLSGNQSTDRSQ